MLIFQGAELICRRFVKFIVLRWRVKYWLRSGRASQSTLNSSLVFSRITSCHQINFTSLRPWVKMTRNPKNHATFFTTQWDEFSLLICTEFVDWLDPISNNAYKEGTDFKLDLSPFLYICPFSSSDFTAASGGTVTLWLTHIDLI